MHDSLQREIATVRCEDGYAESPEATLREIYCSQLRGGTRVQIYSTTAHLGMVLHGTAHLEMVHGDGTHTERCAATAHLEEVHGTLSPDDPTPSSVALSRDETPTHSRHFKCPPFAWTVQAAAAARPVVGLWRSFACVTEALPPLLQVASQAHVLLSAERQKNARILTESGKGPLLAHSNPKLVTRGTSADSSFL